jgi:hypothetical protein
MRPATAPPEPFFPATLKRWRPIATSRQTDAGSRQRWDLFHVELIKMTERTAICRRWRLTGGRGHLLTDMQPTPSLDH